MTGRLLARLHSLWTRLWNCTSPAGHPPATLTDGYGRRWALWCDGAWIDPADVEVTARVALLERLNASPYVPTLADSPRRLSVVPPGHPVDPWSPAAQLAGGPCVTCAAGHHVGCTSLRTVGTYWGPCTCGCDRQYR